MAPRKMLTLQLSNVLSNSEKTFLKTTQLQHYILECMSADDSEDEDKVRSVDSLEERHSSIIRSPNSQMAVSPLHPLKSIVGKALSELNSPHEEKKSEG